MKADPKVSARDYEKAERAIFAAVGRLEETVKQIVESEVDSLFPDLQRHEKAAMKEKLKKSVKKSVKKVTRKVEDHDHRMEETLPILHEWHNYPYDWPNADQEYRILHAVESAEKAVIHALEEEVAVLFHELEKHEDAKAATQSNKALKITHRKATEHVAEKQEHRRNVFMEGGGIEMDFYTF